MNNSGFIILSQITQNSKLNIPLKRLLPFNEEYILKNVSLLVANMNNDTNKAVNMKISFYETHFKKKIRVIDNLCGPSTKTSIIIRNSCLLDHDSDSFVLQIACRVHQTSLVNLPLLIGMSSPNVSLV